MKFIHVNYKLNNFIIYPIIIYLIPLIIFGIQLIIIKRNNYFEELQGGILITVGYLIFFYIGLIITLKRKKRILNKGIIKKKIWHKNYSFYFLLILLIFISGVYDMDIYQNIIEGTFNQLRGEYLSSDSKEWQPRLLGYLSVIITIITINDALKGENYDYLASLSIITSLLNSILIGGRGYLMLNLGSILILYIIEKRYLKVIYMLLITLIVFLSFSLIRSKEYDLANGFDSIIEYLIIPIISTTSGYNSNFEFKFHCQQIYLAPLNKDCLGNMSSHVLSLHNIKISGNVFGAPGQWYLGAGEVPYIISSFLYGLMSGYYLSPRRSNIFNAIGFYCFSSFIFIYFFADLFITNGLLCILLIISFLKILINPLDK